MRIVSYDETVHSTHVKTRKARITRGRRQDRAEATPKRANFSSYRLKNAFYDERP